MVKVHHYLEMRYICARLWVQNLLNNTQLYNSTTQRLSVIVSYIITTECALFSSSALLNNLSIYVYSSCAEFIRILLPTCLTAVDQYAPPSSVYSILGSSRALKVFCMTVYTKQLKSRKIYFLSAYMFQVFKVWCKSFTELYYLYYGKR